MSQQLIVPAVSEQAPQGELRISIGDDQHLTVATNATKNPVEVLVWGMGETLTRVTPQGTLEPWLAENVRNVDARTWRVTLRKNATFWDGSPVTAAAVATSFRANWATQIATDFMLSKTTQLTVVDDSTLDFTTPDPSGNFPYALSYHQLVVHTGDGTVMTGPYRPVSLDPDRELILAPFLEHWAGVPPIGRIIVTYAADANVRVQALRSGDVEMLYGLQPEMIPQLGPDAEVTTSLTNRLHYLQLNLHRPPLDERAVRQAIALGVDRDALLHDVLGGYGAVATGMFPKDAGVATVSIQSTDHDRAKQLLDEAGWEMGADGVRVKDGRRLTFTTYSFPQRREMTRLAAAIREQLRPLGIDMVVVEVPNIGVQTKDRDFDAAMRSINTLISGDPFFLLSITLSEAGRENTGNYANPRIEALLPALKAERDVSRRQALSAQIQEALRGDDPNVFLLIAPLIVAARKGKVQGYVPDPFTQYFVTHTLALA